MDDYDRRYRVSNLGSEVLVAWLQILDNRGRFESRRDNNVDLDVRYHLIWNDNSAAWLL